MPRVLNKCKGDTIDWSRAISVLRPTKWGNPFSHDVRLQRHGLTIVPTRELAVACYRAWIQTQPQLLQALHELTGKDLVCCCAPAMCHADVLLELANAETQEVHSVF